MKEQIRTVSLVIIAVCLLAQFIIQLSGGERTATSTTLSPASPIANRPSDGSQPVGNYQTGAPTNVTANQINPSSAAQTPARKPNTPNLPNTNMTFSDVSHDFGNIKKGKKLKHKFDVTNTGDQPLQLYNLAAESGLNIISYTTDQIAPGKKGTIEVEINSEGLQGGPFKKIVHVNANANPTHLHLEVAANIVD